MSREHPLSAVATELRHAAAAVENAARLLTEAESGSAGGDRKKRLLDWQDDLRDAHTALVQIVASLENVSGKTA